MHAALSPGIQSNTVERDDSARDRLMLHHLLSLRKPDGWPVVDAQQLLEDIIDGPLSQENGFDLERIGEFMAGASVDMNSRLLLSGTIEFAYRMVVGAVPVRLSVSWPSSGVGHPDWLWAAPGKQWAHPDITVFSQGQHYCGPPFRAYFIHPGDVKSDRPFATTKKVVSAR